MKKTIFLLAILLTIGLVSCSQDDDNDIPTGGQGTGKLYKMSFNVSEFEINSTPLKNQTKAGNLKGDFLQYIIYNEDGSPYSANTLSKVDLIEMNDSTDSNIGFDVELPIGKYIIAALTGPYYQLGYPLPTPINFDTDYSMGNKSMTHRYSLNRDIYYETLSFEVSENINRNLLSFTLKPMWSTVTIDVTNADICNFPTNTALVTYRINPAPLGFYLKNKEPEYVPTTDGFTSSSYKSLDMISIEEFQSGDNISFITDKIENATITMQFFTSNAGPAILLGEQTIYTGNIERGKHIVLKGELPEDSQSENESSIKFNYVEMENVEIPFAE